MTDVIVTITHARRDQLCSRGLREFFQQHDLDWSAFLREGIPASALLATGDAMAERVVRIAEQEHGQ